MRTVTKAKILNFLGLFNIMRSIVYRRDLSDPGIVGFYKDFLKKDSLCFDVGANIGRVTDILLRCGARIIAVEPNPECVRYLRAKYRFNKRVVVVPKALDAVCGKKKLYVCEVNSLSTLSPEWIKACKKSARYEEFNWNKEVEVDVSTLDNLIKDYGRPDYIKIDVEGNESNVLKGLTSGIPMISLEICPETAASTQECMRYLSASGDVRFNLSSGETAVRFDLPECITAAAMAALLRENPRFGYVWARSGNILT
ncbi:MAG: FkbM family methyltransferase [Candidatus Omnitrophica bacterium]|nr:FkbM family methyltransferase [Candidatus Omnitrophota bacterium]